MTKASSPITTNAPKREPDRVAKFQKTELQANMNRWYTYEIWDVPPANSGRLYIVGKYGRVGDRGNIKDYGEMSIADYSALASARIHRKGYHRVDLQEVALDKDGNKVGVAPSKAIWPSSTDPESAIVALIFKEAGEAIAQTLNTTVDQLSQAQIQQGRSVLDQFERARKDALDKGQDPWHDCLRVMADYYNVIPTKLPRKIDPTELVKAFNASDEEVRLQQLEAAIAVYASQQSGASQHTALGCDIRLLDKTSQEYRSLYSMLTSTANGRVTIEGIYSVNIPSERAAYLADPRGKSNRKLLLHGTKNQNIRHIMRMGLIVPRHYTNGWAFGPGIYFANKLGKSQNYCGASGYTSQAPWMVLVSEVSLGKVHEVKGARTFKEPPAGYDSVMGLAYGGYGYDEIIVYRPTQCSVRYLVTFYR